MSRVGGSTGSVSVTYATSDGSAVATADYVFASGTLVFADGEVSKTFTVTILDDSDYEGDETVQLSLSNPLGAALGSQDNATLTINENDPLPSSGVLSISAANYAVIENQASVTLSIARSGGSFGQVSVDYALSLIHISEPTRPR